MTALFVGNPSCLEMSDLFECGTSVLIIDAAVSATIYDSAGVEVTGQGWPLSMAFDSAKNSYVGVTGSAMGITAGLIYRVNYVATDGANVLTDQNQYVRAEERRTT